MTHSTIPNAKKASITGSPLWGMSVDDVLTAWQNMGAVVNADFRPHTPYGLGPRTIYLTIKSDEKVLWIPSYGSVVGHDWFEDDTDQKLFWILWQAGVKILIVGGTSGVADWRENGKIQTGDLVLPWSFRTNAHHRGLKGTEFETAWPKFDLTLDAPFCTELAVTMASIAQKHVDTGLLRKIHTPQDVRVALVVPDGITYETDYDIAMWMAINKTISQMQPDKPPVVTLHGDCVNPVLARLLGIHVAYYHMVANAAQGLGKVDITDTLYPLYLGNFATVAIQMELELMETLQVPKDCACVKSLKTAPQVFNEAMTGNSK